MKRKEKNIIIILVALIFILGALYFTSGLKLKNELVSQLPKQELKENTLVEESIIKPQVTKSSDAENKTQTQIETQNKISLIVLGTTYQSSFQEGDTVYKVMDNLSNQKENNFSFSFRKYPALGIFINEINGLKEGNGKYWLYYVNGKEASVGVSKYELESGDIINWELK
ncbi:MAG: DUF4430 domain-containing protein [Candidatus Paceibacterota bacterium]|jgi:hypothetical protein